MIGATAGTYPALLSAAATEEPDRVFLHCASERSTEDSTTFASWTDAADGWPPPC